MRTGSGRNAASLASGVSHSPVIRVLLLTGPVCPDHPAAEASDLISPAPREGDCWLSAVGHGMPGQGDGVPARD